MKRVFVLLIAFLVSAGITNAQNIMTESFSTGAIPAGWTTPGVGWFVGSADGYPDVSARTSPGMLIYDSYNISNGYVEEIATSSFSLASRAGNIVRAKIWVYKHDYYPSAGGSLLKMFINSAPNLTGATQLSLYNNAAVNSINCLYGYTPIEAAAGWYLYQFDIPLSFVGATNYIMLQGTGDWYNNIQVDDFSIDIVTPITYSAGLVSAPVTAGVGVNTANQRMLNIQITTTGQEPALPITSFDCNTTGTTNLGDISNAKIYYTGTNTTFSPINLFGTVASPGATFTVPGTRNLTTAGVHNFWLVYDIAPSATVGNVVKAGCTSLTAGAVAKTPTGSALNAARTVSAPFGGGTITVGPSGTYTSLADAFDAVCSRGITAPVTLSITGNITQSRTAVFTPLPNSIPVEVKPAPGVTAVISASHGGPIIQTNASSMLLTIDGSNTVGGTTRDLTLNNTGNAATANGINIIGSNVIFVKNVNIQNYSPATGIGIYVSNTATANLTNNQIKKAAYGIAMVDNCTASDISYNVIGSETAADAISSYGFYAAPVSLTSGITGYSFTNNKIIGISNNSTGDIFGVYLSKSYSGNINNNIIRSIANTTGSSVGIYFAGTDGTSDFNTTLKNNIISNLSASTIDGIAAGIWAQNGINLKLYHNTIAHGTASTAYNNINFALLGTMSNIEAKNNMFYNNVTGANKVLIYSGQTVNPFSLLNNNAYYIVGGNLGSYNGSWYSSLDLWKTALGAGAANSDQLSVSADMGFASETDRHIGGLSIGNAQFIVPLMTEVTSDIDGETRTALQNYAGADIAIPIINFTTDLPATSIVCQNANQAFTPVAVPGGFVDLVARTMSQTVSYAWYKGATLYNGDANSTVSANTLTLTSAKTAHNGTYKLNATWAGKTVSSAACAIDVQVPISIAVQPQSAGACFGGAPTVTLNVNATGTINEYIWEKSNGSGFTIVQQSSNSTMIMPLDDPDAVAGDYRVRIIGPGNCGPTEVVSELATITITVPVTNTALNYEFDHNSVCQNTSIDILATGEGTITGYRWQRLVNGVWTDMAISEYPTANTNRLVMEGVRPEQSGQYRCMVEGSEQCAVNELPTPALPITIYPLFTFINHPQSQTTCEGNSIYLGAVGAGNVLNYQWYKDGVAIDAIANPTAQTAFLTIANPKFDASASYTAKLQILDCSGTRWVESNPAEIYVMRPTQITREPDNAKAFVNDRAIFSAQAHNKGKLPPFYQDNYQWYKWDNALAIAAPLVDNDRITGSRSSMLTIEKVEAGDFTNIGDGYFLVVTGTCGSDTSRKATLQEGASVTITTQPFDANICEGSSVEWTVSASASNASANLVYQWYKDGTPIPHAMSDKYQIPAVTIADMGKYSVKVSYLSGEAEAMSDEADLTVNQMPYITVQPDAAVTVDNAKELRLNIAADGFAPLAYQWMKDGYDIAGADQSEFVIASVAQADAGTYSVKITNTCGEVISNDCVVTVTKHNSSVENNISGLNVSNISPNPANSSAKFSIISEFAQHAEISLNDASGREVASLFNGMMNEGTNSFDINSDKLNIASGTYFVVIRTNSGIMTRYFVVIK